MKPIILKYTREEWITFFQSHPKVLRMRRKAKPCYLVPSINHYYGQRGIVTKQKKVMIQKFLLPESIAYLDFISHLLQKKGYKRVSKDTELLLEIKAYYKDNRRRDTDNPKAVLDSIKDDTEKGVDKLMADDSQIFETRYRKILNATKDRVVIRISEMPEEEDDG